MGNLPVQLTSFVGRQAEVAAVRERLRDTRLLTLTGAGGIGKTRLAVRVAEELTGFYRHGEWLVELAALTDPTLLPRVVAQSLGVPERPGQAVASALRDHLRSTEMLLVLDNCEHLVAACAELAENLLRACPELHILATSREPLGVAGETIWRVPSLTVPDAHAVQGTDEASGYGAVQLFLDRARAGVPEFTLTDGNLRAVLEICQRLDGVPLALELAAARVRILSPDQIAGRLYNRFRLLTEGSRSALPRQQTLRGAMDWSYSLLSGADQLLFDRLAVFAGGFRLEGVEDVCSGEGLPIEDVLDTLGRLVDRSLVQREEHAGEARYRLLETVRQYAWERLAERGHDEVETVHRRHAGYFLRQAEEAASAVIGPHQTEWLDRIGREHDNMRATLRWALDHEPAQGETALRVATALTLFWEIHGHRTEGLGWLTSALGRHPQAPDTVRAGALKSAGTLAYSLSQFGQSSALLEESLGLYRGLGDRAEVAVLLTRIGRVAHFQGRYAQSTALLNEAIDEARLLRDDAVLPRAYWFLGETYASAGNWASAAGTLEEARVIARRVGDNHMGGHLTDALGEVLRRHGQSARGRGLLDEALGYFESIGDNEGIASTLLHLAVLAVEHGDYASAEPGLRRSLGLSWELGYLQGLSPVLVGLAVVAQHQELPERAAHLLGAAEALRESIAAPLPPADRDDYERLWVAVREVLGDAAFADACHAGRGLSLERAVGLGSQPTVFEQARPVELAQAAAEPDSLTRREREVLLLVARGHSNREIAELLVVSVRTTEAHVTNLLTKLNLRSRAQLAVWATARGMLENPGETQAGRATSRPRPAKPTR